MGHRFLHLNKGKRSIALNVKNPRGRDAFLKLAPSADVMIYNVLGYTEEGIDALALAGGVILRLP